MNDAVLEEHRPGGIHPSPSNRLRQETASVAPSTVAPLCVTSHAIPPNEWEATVADFDGVCQEQTYRFGHLRWPSLLHEPRVFKLGNEIVGGALMHVQRLPFGIGSVAIGKWGPMLKDARRPDRLAIYRGMVTALVNEYARQRGLMLSILARAAADIDKAEFDTLMSLNFREGSNVPFPDRYLVNLQISDTEQRASFDQKWRYHLKRSEKSGLTFHHANRDEFADFARLYDAMSSRKKFPDYSAYNTLPSLIGMTEENLRPEIFLVRRNDTLVAGAIIFKAGDTATYLYGATNDEALPLRAGYFMHWHIIRWLRQNTRARWYDLGGTDGFTGLHQFKKGMVGEAGAIVALPPMANYAAGKWPYLVGTSAYAARDLVLNINQRLRWLWKDQAKPDQVRTSGER
jgi:hypothetical protein